MCEGGEAAPRASPRLAEVDAPIERMLAQGMGHFKREEGMEPGDLPCSRNARSRTPLVGRTQWKIDQPPSLEITSELGGIIHMDGGRSTRRGRQSRPSPKDGGGKVEEQAKRATG